MPPQYVKAYVKRNKNDAADAEAICEAVKRPSMRFVTVKTAEQQSALLMHRGRELLVRQRTMLANALRGHLAEFGIIATQGLHKVAGLIAIVRDAEDERVPDMARQVLRLIAEQIAELDTRIAAHRGADHGVAQEQILLSQRLATIPALGRSSPPPLRRLSRARRVFTAAGTSPPGSVSCRDKTPPAARLASAGSANGATAISGACWSTAPCRLLRSKAAGRSLADALRGRKPRMVVAVALANKTARIAWARMTRQSRISYRSRGSGIILPTRGGPASLRGRKRDGKVGRPTDREKPVCLMGHRPRATDQASIRGSHQGQRPCVPRSIGRTHDRKRPSRTRKNPCKSWGPSTHETLPNFDRRGPLLSDQSAKATVTSVVGERHLCYIVLMIPIIKELLRRVEAWPQEDQEELVEIVRDIEARRSGDYHATPSELEAIDEALGQVARGERASQEQVQEAFSSFRA